MLAHYISVGIIVTLAVSTVALPAVKDEARMITQASLPERQDSTPGHSRPRTWNKPYYGTPSAQCRRNPGTGSLPSRIEEAGVHTDLTNHDSDRKDPTATSNTILSRQPHEDPAYINNDLLAAFHFSCPQGGAMSQIFMWGVVYFLGATNVEMVPWHNILGFTGTHLARNTGRWASEWNSMWCVPHDKLECWYTATAFTAGALNQARDHISIGLVTNPNDHRFAPTVHENCVGIGASRIGAVGSTCIIQEVQIDGQGSRV